MAIAGGNVWWKKLAARDTLPVFVARGRDSATAEHRFFSRGGARRVDSPRHAQVLLVAGRVPENLHNALHQVHDQLPHPRISVWWGSAPPESLRDIALRVSDDGSVPAPADLTARLFAADYRSEPDLLSDQPPAPWRGRGDHGQGGEGMMGGKPFGRPMAMTGFDLRDGLQLDRPRLTVGPFFSALPAGLSLELELQGDVIQDIRRCHPPFPPDRHLLEAFLGVHSEPATIARLERLRAAFHLHHLAHYLRLCGLSALARRFMRVADGMLGGGRPKSLAPLRKAFLRSAAIRATAPGFGQLNDVLLHRIRGPARRAAGDQGDLHREALPGSEFFPARHAKAGDLRARLWQWLHEAEAACALATRLEGSPAESPAEGVAVESPVGRIAAPLSFPDADPHLEPSAQFKSLLEGMEWQEAMLFLASFDAVALRQLLGVVESAAADCPGEGEVQ